MDIRSGDRVMVNLAPFIGSKVRSRQSVPCEVLAVREDALQIVTEYPCRRCELWVDLVWLDDVIDGAETPARKKRLVPA